MPRITTMEGLLRAFFIEMAGELRVCLPGRIESYDADTHLASIQPLIKRKFYGQKTALSLPIVNRVPIVHTRTANAYIRPPVTRGDQVTIIFTDRSLEAWIQGDGAESEALDTRQHHISDAFAILGGYTEKQKIIADNPDAFVFHVEPGTKITIGNGSEELLQIAHDAFTELKNLVDELSQTLADIQLLTVTSAGSGSPSSVPINAASFATIKGTVDGIGTQVDAAITNLGKIKV